MGSLCCDVPVSGFSDRRFIISAPVDRK